MAKSMIVEGNVEAKNDIKASGNLTINGTSAFKGNSTFSNKVNIGSDIIINQDSSNPNIMIKNKCLPIDAYDLIITTQAQFDNFVSSSNSYVISRKVYNAKKILLVAKSTPYNLTKTLYLAEGIELLDGIGNPIINLDIGLLTDMPYVKTDDYSKWNYSGMYYGIVANVKNVCTSTIGYDMKYNTYNVYNHRLDLVKISNITIDTTDSVTTESGERSIIGRPDNTVSYTGHWSPNVYILFNFGYVYNVNINVKTDLLLVASLVSSNVVGNTNTETTPKISRLPYRTGSSLGNRCFVYGEVIGCYYCNNIVNCKYTLMISDINTHGSTTCASYTQVVYKGFYNCKYLDNVQCIFIRDPTINSLNKVLYQYNTNSIDPYMYVHFYAFSSCNYMNNILVNMTTVNSKYILSNVIVRACVQYCNHITGFKIIGRSYDRNDSNSINFQGDYPLGPVMRDCTYLTNCVNALDETIYLEGTTSGRTSKCAALFVDSSYITNSKGRAYGVIDFYDEVTNKITFS